MNCYNKFAQIYDELIHNDVDYKRWANIIIDLYKEYGNGGGDYLDLACGTGNLTSELYSEFKRTWAVDLSQEMLMEAENKLRLLNMRPKFVKQDISNLKLNHKFDIVTCCLDSTNYITEDEALENYFKSVYEHLNNEGIFIFDINSYYKLNNILADNVFTFDDDDVVYIWDNNIEDDIVNMYLTFFIKNGEVYERFDEEHCERAYKEEQIENLLLKQGFTLVKKLDNYELREPEYNSERIVYVVKK